MTDTQRRALIGAIALAPVAGAASVAAAMPAADLAALDTDALLRYGATLPDDAAFAELCAVALNARRRSDDACSVCTKAEGLADEETPPYPAALCYTVTVRGWPDLETKRAEQRRWRPDDENGWTLWNLAHREARRRGGAYSRALEDELRQQYHDWRAAVDAANTRHHIAALDEASMAAGREACQALDVAISHPARSPAVLLVQLHLRRSECLLPDGEHAWARLVGHVERALI